MDPYASRERPKVKTHQTTLAHRTSFPARDTLAQRNSPDPPPQYSRSRYTSCSRRHSRSKPFLTEADKFWRPLPTPRKLHAAMFGSCRCKVRIGSKRLFEQIFGSAYHGLFTTMHRKPQRLPERHPPGQLVSQKARMRGMLPTTKDQMLKQTLDRSNMFRTCTMQSSYPNVLKTPCKPKIAKATIQLCRKNLPVPCNQLQSIISITYQSHYLYIHSKQGPHTFGHPTMQVCMKPSQCLCYEKNCSQSF